MLALSTKKLFPSLTKQPLKIYYLSIQSSIWTV
uniref:(California timema) hypothetical protein n=1 Tax=Timema californicum TaxID=61474 RepID=A0A7R9JND3_TIMCA|nr:unnamed protein product [Timema californicum]